MKPFLIADYPSETVSEKEHLGFNAIIESIVSRLLPPKLLEKLQSEADAESKQIATSSFFNTLPLLFWKLPKQCPSTLVVNLLCPAKFTHGVGCYLCEALAKGLTPGSFLSISSVRSHRFHFVSCEAFPLFFNQVLLDVRTEEDLLAIQQNKLELEKELLLTLSAIRHARQLISSSRLSKDQKKNLIEDSIDPLLLKPSFIAERPPRLISRLISYQYLFRKLLLSRTLLQPLERHLSLKLIKNASAKRDVIGVCGCINLIRKNELFEEKHLLKALSHSLPPLLPIPNSLIMDKTAHESLRFFYVEIQKEIPLPFNSQEILSIQKHLSRELKESIESALPPLLKHRNEEEVLRNVLLLAKQLKFVNDPPQVMISFDEQTNTHLQFTVLLVRILKQKGLPLRALIKNTPFALEIKELETKKVGLFKGRYPKEATIFSVYLEKGLFVRRDFSIDLLKARQTVLLQLGHLFKEIRDFNGGILSKQQETLQALKTHIAVSPSKELLLEKFFYSISPPLKQTMIPLSHLKSLFLLLLEALDADYKKEPFFFKAQRLDSSLLILLSSPFKDFKEKIATLDLPLTPSCRVALTAYAIPVVGYIYSHFPPNLLDSFCADLSKHLQAPNDANALTRTT